MPEVETTEMSGAWPIELNLGATGGYTLWISDERSGSDLLLGTGEAVSVFPTVSRLEDFIWSRVATNLDSTGAFQDLRSSREKLHGAMASPAARFDLWRTSRRLLDKSGVPTIEELRTILDDMWMAKDIAFSTGDVDLEASMRVGPIWAAIDILTTTTTLLGEGSPIHDDSAVAWMALPVDLGTTFASIVEHLGSRLIRPD